MTSHLYFQYKSVNKEIIIQTPIKSCDDEHLSMTFLQNDDKLDIKYHDTEHDNMTKPVLHSDAENREGQFNIVV